MITPTNPIVAESATVYRGGRRRWFSKTAALKSYAAEKFRAKHQCECEDPDYSSGYGGYECHVHNVRDRVMPRYLRFLTAIGRRDGWL